MGNCLLGRKVVVHEVMWCYNGCARVWCYWCCFCIFCIPGIL